MSNKSQYSFLYLQLFDISVISLQLLFLYDLLFILSEASIYVLEKSLFKILEPRISQWFKRRSCSKHF